MKNMEKNDTLENLYENCIKEKIELEKIISKLEIDQNRLDDEFINYNNNFNESRIFSPRQNVISYNELVKENRKKFHDIKEEIELHNRKLMEVNSQISAIEEIKNQIEVQSNFELLSINENDRKKIARELHDSTIQSLVYLIHKVEITSKFIDQDPIRARLELNTITNSLKNVIQEMRELVYDLHPMNFEDLGFEATLTKFFDDISSCSNMEVSYECHLEYEKYDEIVLITLFRIIQECCNNAIKHSKGKMIFIHLGEEGKFLYLIVRDDGIGFSNNEQDKNNGKHFGLKIIKERVFLLSGKCEFISSDKGLEIQIKIPIRD